MILLTLLVGGIGLAGLPGLCTGTSRIQQCGSDGYMRVVENEGFNLTCVNHPVTMVWQTFIPEYGNQRITMCNQSNCSVLPSLTNFFSMRRLSSTSTELSVDSIRTGRDIFAGSHYRCEDTTCTLDITVPAIVTSATVTPETSGSPWILQGAVVIANVYSSGGRYSCQWSQGGQNLSVLTESMTLNPPANSTSNKNNRTGSCAATWALPSNSGQQVYQVEVIPGNTQQQAGTISVERPTAPTSSCPGDYVPEYSPLSCTCASSNLGNPRGSLVGWSSTSPSSAQLSLSNVTRSQDNHVYTCRLTWNNLDFHHNFTLRVAYGPASGRTTITGPDVFDTDGSRDLTVTCSTSTNDVSPSPTISWDQPSACRGQGQGSCTFRPQPLHNVTVTCRVTNSKNNGHFQTVDKVIVLNYPPTEPPSIAGYTTGTALYMNTPLTLTCSVLGGEPSVSSVTLDCDNYPRNTSAGQQSQLTVTSLRANDHLAVCTCSATWKVTSLYTRTSNVTLTVYYPSTVTIFTLNSSPANLTISAGDVVTLTCEADGRPAPHLSLVRPNGHVLVNVSQGQLSASGGGTATTNFTTQCVDTGVYVCNVNSGFGSSQHRLALHVQCPPELAESPGETVPVITMSVDRRVATFTVAAFPTPTISSLLRRLPDGSFSDQLVDIFFTTHCHRASSLTLDVICNVTLIAMTSASAEGVYRANVSNTFGSLDVEFRVDFVEEDDSPSELSAGAGAGFMAAGVFVLGVVVVLWLWRRDWILPCNKVVNNGSPKKRDSLSPSEHQLSDQPQSPSLQVRHTLGPEEPAVPNNYDELRLQEVGLPSVYSEISPYHNTGARADNSDRALVYEDRSSTKASPYSNVHAV